MSLLLFLGAPVVETVKMDKPSFNELNVLVSRLKSSKCNGLEISIYYFIFMQTILTLSVISTFCVNRKFSSRHFQSLSAIGKPVQLLARIKKDVWELA